MKKIKLNKEFIKKNKFKIILFSIILILILIAVFFVSKKAVTRIAENKKAEEFNKFYFEKKDFKLSEEDFSYIFEGVVVIQEINGIESITYTKNGQDVTVSGNGKNKIAIDYDAKENTDYTFKIKPINEDEKQEVLHVERKVAGENTYKLVNGIYVNTPFLENFNSKYTRYLNVDENGNLTPANWITDSEPRNWYSYKDRNWANIYVEHEGVEVYYVWIPRYVYKLDQDTQRSDIKFVDVYNNYTNAETGETLTSSELIAQGYQLPEAFNFGDSNVATAISGYWMSKYQLSELEKFNIDFNMSATKGSIQVSNFTNNVSNKAKKYTYAINGQIKHESEKAEDYLFEGLEEGKTYVVNITALDENNQIVGSMTKEMEPTEVNPPDLTGFDPDTTFYVYWDENGIEHSEIPISKSAPSEWYNYTYSNWANIVTRNDGLESYYVWIPRYQYALNQTSQRSNVKFILGTSNDTTTGYAIPEAFWFDKNDNGEEDEGEQLTGYWMSKYQLSKEETEARVSAELSADANCIRVRDIQGTETKTKDTDGKTEIDRNVKIEYYLNGDLQYTGTSLTEHYIYKNLETDKLYIINIMLRDSSTNEYIGSITKKVRTKTVNEPDLSSFKSNEELKNRTYYCIYENNEISKYIPISEKAPNNWYNYSEANWANIVVTDGTINGNKIENATTTSYFTWIPRYEYKILSSQNDWSNRSTKNARTDVIFINGTSTQTDEGYAIPEAFWFDKNDNETQEDDEQLTGYWMSKYQLSDS